MIAEDAACTSPLLAGDPGVNAAFLFDPVDCTRYAPETVDNPSAARALAASGRAVGIAGAGMQSGCNPVEGNYEVPPPGGSELAAPCHARLCPACCPRTSLLAAPLTILPWVPSAARPSVAERGAVVC